MNIPSISYPKHIYSQGRKYTKEIYNLCSFCLFYWLKRNHNFFGISVFLKKKKKPFVTCDLNNVGLFLTEKGTIMGYYILCFINVSNSCLSVLRTFSCQ